MSGPRELLEPVLELHDAVRQQVVAATERQASDALARVSREEQADTIYAIDLVAEAALDRFAERLSATQPFVLVAEGIPGGTRVWPAPSEHPRVEGTVWRVIVDPIDGTRGLMYQKRSAWILTAVAPDRGPGTSLQDIVLAVQTEIPLVKQHLCDQLVAIKGEGITAHRYNRLTDIRTPLTIQPSTATTIAHGYASIARFFPGHRDQLAALDEEIVRAALGAGKPGKALCFEDQYASTGGQLYELLMGHDRFVADLRPLVERNTPAPGPRPLCCHPYDICTSLIATEAGVVITNPYGQPLDVPLDVATDVAWVGYANHDIRRQIEPLLQVALRGRGWI